MKCFFLGRPHNYPQALLSLVNISVVWHWLFGKMDFEDINYEDSSYDKMASYHQSKLANLLFTKELHNKTKDHATRIFSLNRGFVVTELG